MKKTLIALILLAFLVAAYFFVAGEPISFTPGVTMTAVKLYDTEADADAQTESFQVLPINTKCYLTKVGSKYNSKRVRCENPDVEGWVIDFHLFMPRL